MNIGAWNVRGLNGPLTQNKVANLAWQHKLSIFGLHETKLRLERVPPFVHRNLEDGIGVQIWILWKGAGY